MTDKNRYVRHTLIWWDEVPPENLERVQELCREFDGLGYIDATTQIGPDQARRMSQRQKDKLGETAARAFQIEREIKQLLKPVDQVEREARKRRIKELESKANSVKSQMGTLASAFPKKMASNRDNATKRTMRLYAHTLEEIETELDNLKKQSE